MFYTDRKTIIKDVIKRAMNKAQKEIDTELTKMAREIVEEYYKDFDPVRSTSRWRYVNTYNFLNDSYYLTHHQNISSDGRRHYRYIHLWFSSEKMNDIYVDYYGKRFDKDKVFYQNFHRGYHGRAVFRGKKRNEGYWLKGVNNYIPKQELEKRWKELRSNHSKNNYFNKMMDAKVNEAYIDIQNELEKEFDNRFAQLDRIGGKK